MDMIHWQIESIKRVRICVCADVGRTCKPDVFSGKFFDPCEPVLHLSAGWGMRGSGRGGDIYWWLLVRPASPGHGVLCSETRTNHPVTSESDVTMVVK
jgi:hypothetical protein